MRKKNLIIVGDSAFAQIACEYFTADTNYEVVCFSVERSYLKNECLLGRPIIPFEELQKLYPPQTHDIFVAVVYSELNRLRARLAMESKNKGYSLATYISPRAFIWNNVKLGEHCFVFENNTIQPFVEIGDDVILWSGNHIGHHSKIGDHCFVSSHVVISGYCYIGKYSFLGVNSTIANNVILGDDNWVGPSVTIMKNSQEGSLFQIEQSLPSSVSSYRFFKVQK